MVCKKTQGGNLTSETAGEKEEKFEERSAGYEHQDTEEERQDAARDTGYQCYLTAQKFVPQMIWHLPWLWN